MTGADKTVGLAADVISELKPQGQVALQYDVGASAEVPDKPETAGTAVRPAEAEAIRPKPDRSEGLQIRPHREIVDVIERKDVETVVELWNLVGAGSGVASQGPFMDKFFRCYDESRGVRFSANKMLHACNFFGLLDVYTSNSTLMTTWGSR
jgi:hypothetical protein